MVKSGTTKKSKKAAKVKPGTAKKPKKAVETGMPAVRCAHDELIPLEKLTRKGYLCRHKGEPSRERGGRSKFLYDLTAAGRKALREIREVQETAWAGVPKVALD